MSSQTEQGVCIYIHQIVPTQVPNSVRQMYACFVIDPTNVVAPPSTDGAPQQLLPERQEKAQFRRPLRCVATKGIHPDVIIGR